MRPERDGRAESEWPRGDGEMARRIRAHHWARTPLGPTEGWSPVLRGMVDLILAARIPMGLHWGPELCYIYNDAWIELARGRHPVALGQPAREVFADSWAAVGSLYDAVMAGGQAFLAHDQLFPKELNGRAEDAWWTYNLSPIRCEAGSTLGVLGVGLETTAQHRVQMALRESEERLTFLLKLSDVCRAARDPQQLVRQASALLGTHLLLNRVGYAEVDGDEFVPWEGYVNGVPPMPPGRLPLSSFGARLVERYTSGEAVAIADTETHPLLTPAERQWRRESQVRATLAIPLMRGGRMVSIFGMHSARPRHWTESDRQLAHEAAQRIWTALERTRAEAALRESEARLTLLLRVSDAGRVSSDLQSLVREVCTLLGVDLGVNRVCYAEIDGRQFTTWDGYVDGVSPLPRGPAAIAGFDGPVVAAYQRGETVAVDDVEGSPLIPSAERRVRLETYGFRAFLAVPLLREGRWLATFALHAAQPRHWTLADRQLTEEVAHRVWTALERARAVSALRDSEERLRLALDVAGIGTWDWDVVAGTSVVDTRSAEMLEVGPGRISDVAELQRAIIHPDDLERTLATIEAGIRSGRSFDLQSRVVHRNGQIRHLASRARAFPDETGQIRRLVGTSRDVTAELESEARLRASEARLLEAARQANQAKDEFLAMLGHELRNPLTPILATLELMRLKNDKAHTAERDVIERQARHLARLVDYLLDVTRIVRGKIPLRRKRLDLAAVIRRAVESVSPLLEEKGHRLAVTIEEGLPVDGDADRLQQVFSNLLANAAHYTDRGGAIEVKAHLDRSEVVVCVSDSGVGIEPDLLPYVFDLFRQGAQTIDRAQGGLGLGLTIVRKLVELHGGTVSATSAGRGQGSAFTARLPAAVVRAPRGRIVYPARPAAAAPAPSGARVLVVDDNHDIADVVADLLRTRGHQVEVAYSGASGLELARSFRPAIALLDIGLPEMDGYQLARLIKAEQDLRHTQLVAVTGYGQSADRRRARRAGFADHLVKPFEFAELATLVERLAKGAPATKPRGGKQTLPRATPESLRRRPAAPRPRPAR